MTHEERLVLMRAIPQGLVTQWRPIDEMFVALKAGPCPLYAFKTCLVYAVRPFNCRRFGCMRPDVVAEPFEANGANMMDRTNTSRVAWRMAKLMQRKAQRWARKHGWNVETA